MFPPLQILMNSENTAPASRTASYFKGWAKPGPLPVAAYGSATNPTDEESFDAISGHYRIFQLRDGHRFSTDDILTAWYGTTWCPCPRTVLDLGSGVGSVGMVAAWRLQGARFITIEAQEESVRLAKKSAAYNGLTDRYEIRHGDFRDTQVLGTNERFDLILGSPPYFPVGSGVLGDHPQKVACRFELRGNISDYCKIAADHLELGGLFACVFPTEQLERVQKSAADAGLSILRRRPVTLRTGSPPLLSLFAMSIAEHLPQDMRNKTWIEPELTIRSADGSVHPEYAAVKLAIGFPP
jgi:tRNA1(Val) A37 N6-methylase TrmN6